MMNYPIMGQRAIQEQIEVIRRASAKARETPESARQFLIDAGIISVEKQIGTREGDGIGKK